MTKIVIVGAGGLGSRIAEMLARPELELHIIDDDRVEAHNLRQGIFTQQHIGARKAEVVAFLVARKGGQATWDDHALTDSPDFTEYDLVVDALDNHASRALLHPERVNTYVVHVGVQSAHAGAVMWDEFAVPDEITPRGENPVCTRALGADIIRLTAAVAANIIDRFLATGEQVTKAVTTLGVW